MKCTPSTLVPTLALMAGVGVAPAIEVGDLTIGGYVDTIFTVTSVDDGTDDTTSTDFTGDFVLNATYAIGEKVSATGEFLSLGNAGTDNTVELSNATVTWQAHDKVELMMGHFINSLGWQAFYAPGRYRIGASATTAFYGASYNQGLGVLVSASDNLQLDFYIMDYVFDESTQPQDGLGYLADLTYSAGALDVNLELIFDSAAGAAFGGSSDDDVIQLGLNATYTGMENLLLGGEFFFTDFGDDDRMGFLAVANYAFTETVSGSLYAAYVDPSGEGDDDEIIDLTVAVLTAPTGDANFAVNYELSYVSEAGAVDDTNTITAAIEFLAVIP